MQLKHFRAKSSEGKAPSTSDCPPEDPARSPEVVWPTRRVGVHPLAEEGQVLHCEIHQHINTHSGFAAGIQNSSLRLRW